MHHSSARAASRKSLWYRWQVWVFVLIFGAIGSLILTRSHAATTYTVRSTIVYQSTSEGCWLAGRVWDSGSSSCTKSCRHSGSTFVAATSTRLGYCSGAVATDVDRTTCNAANYARRYINNTGCSRKIEQVVDQGATQCIYSNDTYFPGPGHDYCGLVCPSGYSQSTTSHTCVAPAPAPAPTTTSSTPTPTPSPTPTPTSTSTTPTSTSTSPTKTTTSTTTKTTKSTTGSGTPAPTGFSSPANGVVAAGTLSAKVTIPTDGAKSLNVTYGTDANSLSDSSDTVNVVGDSAELTLFGLQAKTKYYYQIIRTDAGGKTGTSSVSTFDTTGFAITLHLIDNSNKPVADIAGVINDSDNTSASSDKNGDLKFYDLDAGTYTVTYKYKNLTYTKDFNTDNAVDDDTTAGKTAVLSDTINVTKLTNGSTKPLPAKKHSSVGKILLLLFFIIAVGGAIVWLLLRRRAASQYTGYGSYSTGYSNPYEAAPPQAPVTVGSAEPVSPAMPTTAVPKLSKKTPAPVVESTENLEHVGESLREMVVRSMHEEAQKRKNQGQ